jgi:hypothetical protein
MSSKAFEGVYSPSQVLGAAEPVVSAVFEGSRVRRRISQQAGQALEKLAHAIEYLTDEYIFDGKTPAEDNTTIQAIQLLMAINRRIYFDCPVVPGFSDRLQTRYRRLSGKISGILPGSSQEKGRQESSDESQTTSPNR